MRRSKEHTFKLSEFDLTQKVTNTFITKVYHRYEHRNEWVNWNGDTGIVHRSGLFDFSLEDSTDAAERLRIQGTRFIIDETPAICAIGTRLAVVLAELFTDNPFRNCLKETPQCSTLEDVEKTFRGAQWFASAVYTGNLEKLKPVEITEIFFSRTSKATGRNSYLGWSLKPRKIDLVRILDCAKNIVS